MLRIFCSCLCQSTNLRRLTPYSWVVRPNVRKPWFKITSSARCRQSVFACSVRFLQETAIFSYTASAVCRRFRKTAESDYELRHVCLPTACLSARHLPNRTHDLRSGSQDHHPSTNWVQKTICCNLTSSAPDEERMRPKHVEIKKIQ